MNKLKSILFKLGLAKYPTSLKTRHLEALVLITQLQAELDLAQASKHKKQTRRKSKSTK